MESQAIHSNRFLVPRLELDGMFDKLSSSQTFSSLEITTGEGNGFKRTFKTKNGLYEWLVMPVDIPNAASSFMRFMEQVFKPFIGKFLIVYCNDILFFTKDSDSHITHLRTVFELLRQYQLYVIPKYSLVGASRVKFLGFIVSDKHIQIDPVKILAITNYPIPKSLADLRYFHGLVTFCKRFIRKCNIITAPITECLKTKNYTWNSQVEESFQEIKRRIASAPILSLPDADKTFRIDFDATKYGVGAILCQEGCLIAYFSKKLNGA